MQNLKDITNTLIAFLTRSTKISCLSGLFRILSFFRALMIFSTNFFQSCHFSPGDGFWDSLLTIKHLFIQYEGWVRLRAISLVHPLQKCYFLKTILVSCFSSIVPCMSWPTIKNIQSINYTAFENIWKLIAKCKFSLPSGLYNDAVVQLKTLFATWNAIHNLYKSHSLEKIHSVLEGSHLTRPQHHWRQSLSFFTQ